MKSSFLHKSVATLITISFVGTSLLAPFTAQAEAQKPMGGELQQTDQRHSLSDIFSDPKMQKDLALIGVTCVMSVYILPEAKTLLTSGADKVAEWFKDKQNKIEAKVLELADIAVAVPPVPPAIAAKVKQTAADAVVIPAGGAMVVGTVVGSPVPILINSSQFTPIAATLLAIGQEISGLHDRNTAGQSAAAGATAKEKAKDTMTDCLVYGAGQLLLRQLTQDTVNWIKGGYHGGPNFSVNTHEIFLDLADSVAGDLAREIRGVAMCKFSANFQNDLANNIELSAKHIYKFNGATKCPFPETFNINSSDFYKGVNNFSWGAMEYAMQDNGNPFGVALLSGQELALRSSEKKDVQKQELSWSNGFTNMVDTANCNYPDKYAGSGDEIYYDRVSNAEIADYAMAQRDLPKDQQTGIDTSGIVKLDPKDVRALQKQYCPTTTPGKILGDQLTKATGLDMDRLGAIDSINKIVGAVIEQAMQSASMGIFNAVSGQDAKVQQNYITVQDKTAETIAMENYAIKNAKDALAEAKLNLQDENAKEPAGDPEKIYLLQQEVDAAQKKVDAVTSVEYAINRQAELTAANAEVSTALSAERSAQARADATSRAYYDALGGSLSGGTYIQPDPATLADLKLAWDTANNAFVVAQGVTAAARQRLYDAQHPVGLTSTPLGPAGGGQ